MCVCVWCLCELLHQSDTSVAFEIFASHMWWGKEEHSKSKEKERKKKERKKKERRKKERKKRRKKEEKDEQKTMQTNS